MLHYFLGNPHINRRENLKSQQGSDIILETYRRPRIPNDSAMCFKSVSILNRKFTWDWNLKQPS
jgi:hypothetical protein